MGLYSKGIWMGMEGNSAIVKAHRGTLKGMFNRFSGGAVVKAFKPASSSHMRQAAINTEVEFGIRIIAILPTMAPTNT